ncbi:HlyD family efflux transporter periplasmic adaptor subunit [Synechococcus sp. YX-04-1]|uniref:HlyD family efflux transporter periplasmic adaptor subunit n=1 Tax=Synechococcus sp. YX-04-1 TaxID=3062778 RepID=UPI0026E45D28|nr:HlyD family efflux transporter periplasmic adaptor subunit [Synechococcus sp. YX-04-1]MDO6351172.1 HlyD family efflux transporter periplasmic adaptor subunit [Synechococcus sp. YX-04-1]
MKKKEASDSVDTDAAEKPTDNLSLSVKKKASSAIDQWMAKNRSLVLRQTPVWAQTLVAVAVSLSGIALLGGIFFRIDEVITVQGQLKSIGGTVDVETPAGGRVEEVLFKDGDYVEKGDLLVRFDTRDAAQQKQTNEEIIELQQAQFASQAKSLDSQINSLSSRQDVLKQRLETQTYISKEMKTLVEAGGYQKLQYLSQLDQIYELKQQISEIDEQKERAMLQLNQVTLNNKRKISELKSAVRTAELQLQYKNVVSPVAGIIFDPQVTSQSVSQPGERIVSIVSQNGLFGEVLVSNRDIGYIQKGQDAKIRVDAFPFASYGEIDSKISNISADVLPPSQEANFFRFPIKLKMNNSYLLKDKVKIPLKPGMSISANIKLRDKPVISLLSDILVDQTDSVRSIRQQ